MRKRLGFFAYWPSQIKGFLMLLILVASGILLVAADFGESSDSLGQITDEFTSLDNISVAVNVVRNATLNAMELNTTAGGAKLYEDFNAYTQVEPADRVDVINSTHVAHRAERDEDSYLYLDYGVDYFDNFTHQFVWESDFQDLTGIGYLWMVSDRADDALGIDVAGGDFLGLQTHRDGTGRRLILRECDAGTLHTQFWIAGPLANTLYYTNISKYGTDLTARTYDDPGMTNLVNTMSITLQRDHKLEFIIPVNTYNSGHNVVHNSDVYNLWIGRSGVGFEPDGYFTTEDYLDQVNGSTLSLMTIAYIPASGGITVEFSTDNATWVNQTALTDGLGCIDLRFLNESGSLYLNYSLTTSDISETPRLNQSRLITTEGPVVTGAGAPGQNVSGEWTFYNASEVGVTVGTLDAGSLTSLHVPGDGDIYNVSEVVGAPGMGISVNFTGIDPGSESVWLICFHLYDGNQVHDFDKEVWNYTSSAWLEFGHFGDGTEFVFQNASVYALRIPSEFLSGGAMRFRFDHEAAGNINHDLYLDFVNVLAFTPTGPALGAGAVTVIETDPAPWIAIAIILMCVAYLLLRSR